MTASRDRILETLRSARRARGGAEADAASAQLVSLAPNLVPQRGSVPPEDRVRFFVEEAQRVSARIGRVVDLAAIPEAVAAAARDIDLPSRLKCAPDPALATLDWGSAGLAAEFGAATGDDRIGVARAFAGVAETGTVVLLSGPERPTTVNFLPTLHVVILESRHIAGSYEDVWARMRAERGTGGFMPRAVNWITGPSRTADIEQQLLLGAHGPRELLIILVGSAAEEPTEMDDVG